MKVLPRIQFGSPLLRQVTKPVEVADIKKPSTQALITNMRYTLEHKKLGVGLAAPQVGSQLAIAIIKIQKTELRPDAEPFETVLINPKITHTYGRRTGKWEGCISAGSHGQADLFAKALRYSEIEISYVDDTGKSHTRKLSGLPAHVAQHEIDHLNGILFVDRVSDRKTFMTYKEYIKRVKSQPAKT